jgi:hypothetical protein
MTTISQRFFQCSDCNLVSTEKLRLTRHLASKGCAGATCQEFVLDIQIPAGDNIAHRRREEKRLWLERRVIDRLPSGLSDLESIDTIGIDERTEYLCDHPEIAHKVFDVMDKKPPRMHPAIHVALKMFDYLWGKRAPLRFQSVFTYKRMLRDINAIADPEDPMTVDILTYKTKDQIDEFIINVWEGQREIAEAVSNRHPEEPCGQAARVYHNLTGGNALLSVADVLEKNRAYERYRKRYSEIVRLANNFRREFRLLAKSLRV